MSYIGLNFKISKWVIFGQRDFLLFSCNYDTTVSILTFNCFLNRFLVHTAHQGGLKEIRRMKEEIGMPILALVKHFYFLCTLNGLNIPGLAWMTEKQYIMQRNYSWRPIQKWSLSVEGMCDLLLFTFEILIMGCNHFMIHIFVSNLKVYFRQYIPTTVCHTCWWWRSSSLVRRRHRAEFVECLTISLVFTSKGLPRTFDVPVTRSPLPTSMTSYSYFYEKELI